MEAKLLLRPSTSFLPAAPVSAGQTLRRHMSMLRVNAVLTSPADERINGFRDTADIVYRDSWFDRLAIHHLSKSVQETTGLFNKMEGYDSLVEAARSASKNFNPVQQRELVVEALYKAFPKPILSMIKMVLPDSKLKREYFAAFTTLFFAWLIGPCEVRASEHNGRMEKNVVHIQKCRFLQESNCVGMCTNLCKFPSQAFIKDSFGMPVNMVPNFDDMSCQMVFGQEPPSPDQDPALKQPCYKLCKIKQRHSTECTSE
ncbi:hypothetical protein QQ045_030767 [Rhodiola kirilowii]